MTPTEKKKEFIRLRAEGHSFASITEKLHISKGTCSKWEKELEAQVAQLKQEELNTLYEEYGMKKQARIKNLGKTLNKVEDALEKADFSQVPPEKLLDMKLKYSEALQKEYTGTQPAYKLQEGINPKAIVDALGDLLNRVRAGEVSKEQADKESAILGNLLKAYDTVEVKAKLDEIEKLLESGEQC